jgi:hypothetical protein
MPLPSFDVHAMFAALDGDRRTHGLQWPQLADTLWLQSADLNDRLDEGHAMCPGALVRVNRRDTIGCQYALVMLRWLDRAPEDFLTGPVADVGDTQLPRADAQHRLRWDLPATHAELNARRQDDGLTWAALGDEIGCTPARLTNLRTAKLADMDLAMKVVQYLGMPAAAFVHPATW